MRKTGFSLFVAFLLTLSLLAVPALAPPVASAQDIADLPNPLTVSFSASVSEGDSYSFFVVPDPVDGSVINQFSRDWMIINQPAYDNTPARFFNMSTASGSISGDLSGSIDFKWNRIDFATPYLPAEGRFIASPDGVGILYIKANVTDTILGDLTIVGAADLDYTSSSVKGEGIVMSVEDWTKGLTTAPDRVLIGEMSYEISGGTITGTFSLRNYSQTPVGLEGKVDPAQSWLYLEGQLINDESDEIIDLTGTGETVEFMQFTRGPVDPYHRIVLEEMAPGREADQDITAGDAGVGGTISLLRTGVLDVIDVQEQDIPVYAITGTRTVEDNWASNIPGMRGVAKTVVLVDMTNFDFTGIDQQSYTIMPGYTEGYLGEGYYAGFEAYVIPYTHISLTLYLAGDDYRYSLLPTPVVSAVIPNVGQGGDTFEVTINGKWFWVNETFHPLTIDFGVDVTVNSHTVVSDTEITASITIDGGAGIGASDVSVTKRGQTGTLSDGFGVGSAVDGLVVFPARTIGTDAYIEPFSVTLFDVGTTNVHWSGSATTNNTGVFTITGFTPDTYDIAIKNWTCLSELKTNVVLTLGATTVVAFTSTTREGDSNNDDWITMADLSLLLTGWGSQEGDPNYSVHYDFNRDGWVTMADLSLMLANWGDSGDLA